MARIETFARVGDAADAILDVADEQGSDLIVVGNKGMTGATRFLLGSVPNKVSHHAPCLMGLLDVAADVVGAGVVAGGGGVVVGGAGSPGVVAAPTLSRP